MSARTRKNSASPPTMSNVSGEVAFSPKRVGAAAAAAFNRPFFGLVPTLGFVVFGLAALRL